MDVKIGDYNAIMNDRNIFNQIVYTPLSEALRLLDERRKDPVLMAKVEELLKGDIPEILKKKKCAVLFRQVATPNHETRRFISLAKENDLHPVICEYHDDKFTPENEFKYSLGKLTLHHGTGRRGGSKNEFINIIDFNKSNGHKIKDIKTLWEDSLMDFHKELFIRHGYNPKDLDFYEASDWFQRKGGKPENYYLSLLTLFTCFGILFENFLTLKDTEEDFTKKVVLPAIEKVINLVGIKPLIVPLEPLDLETDELWYHHDYKVKDILIEKQK